MNGQTNDPHQQADQDLQQKVYIYQRLAELEAQIAVLTFALNQAAEAVILGNHWAARQILEPYSDPDYARDKVLVGKQWLETAKGFLPDLDDATDYSE